MDVSVVSNSSSFIAPDIAEETENDISLFHATLILSVTFESLAIS